MSERKLRATVSSGWVHLLDPETDRLIVLIRTEDLQQVLACGSEVQITYRHQSQICTFGFRTEEEATQLVELLSRHLRRDT